MPWSAPRYAGSRVHHLRKSGLTAGSFPTPVTATRGAPASFLPSVRGRGHLLDHHPSRMAHQDPVTCVGRTPGGVITPPRQPTPGTEERPSKRSDRPHDTRDALDNALIESTIGLYKTE
jgi:hypothetical protein